MCSTRLMWTSDTGASRAPIRGAFSACASSGRLARKEVAMTTIAILPEGPGQSYRAVAGNKQSVGKTAGEALDALTAQLDEGQRGTMIVVQQFRPDQFFTAT